MTSEKSWLFHWRSYLPLFLAPLLFLVIRDFTLPGGNWVYDAYLEILCLSVTLLGLGIRAYAIGYAAPRTSGGNTAGRSPSC